MWSISGLIILGIIVSSGYEDELFYDVVIVNFIEMVLQFWVISDLDQNVFEC